MWNWTSRVTEVNCKKKISYINFEDKLQTDYYLYKSLN